MAPKSLCKGKRVSNPNKCKKITACKVTKSGKRPSYCRLKRNKTQKKKAVKKTARRMPEGARLRGLNKKQTKALKNLGVKL